MAKSTTLQTFYASDAWRNFRMRLIAERGLLCQHCRERVVVARDITLHHVVSLTSENVRDTSVSLNPANVVVVHHACHNQIHKRNVTKEDRKVVMVYGPPLSGKSSYVRARIKTGDMVIDYDQLFLAVSGKALYEKPNELLPNVQAMHRLLLDHCKTRYGKWTTAWVIGGYADRYKREKLSEELGAQLIKIEATKEECMKRLKEDRDRSKQIALWTGYIDKWFSEYTA